MKNKQNGAGSRVKGQYAGRITNQKAAGQTLTRRHGSPLSPQAAGTSRLPAHRRGKAINLSLNEVLRYLIDQLYILYYLVLFQLFFVA